MKPILLSIVAITFSATPSLGEVPEPLGIGSSPSLSRDGRYVAFGSTIDSLVPEDTNQADDILLLDRDSGQISRVSVAADGTQGNGVSFSSVISSDGGFVAFASGASNLVPGDTNGKTDVFLYNVATKEIWRVSVRSDGTEANGGEQPRISGDGRYVAFYAQASNLLSPDSSTLLSGIFVHDRQTGHTGLASVTSDGNPAADVIGYDFALSADGRFVAFVSPSSGIVAGDNNSYNDVFLYDRVDKTTRRVSVASGGGEAVGMSEEPSLSSDGRFVAFKSSAPNLAADDDNPGWDVFVHDRLLNQTKLISRSSRGTVGHGSSQRPRISEDGGRVAFISAAVDLDTPPWPFAAGVPNQIYVRDILLQRTVLASTGGGGCADFARNINWFTNSGDGRYVAFQAGLNLYLTDLALNRKVFAHYVNGELNGVPNRSRLVLRNAGSAEENGQIRFRDEEGNPSPTMIGGQLVTAVDYTLPAWGTFELQTDGTGAIASGSIEVTTSLAAFSEVIGTEVFDVLGSFVSIDACPIRRFHQVHVSVNPLERTGVALYNPSDQEITNIRLKLRDSIGWHRVDAIMVRLRAHRHRAFFVDELFTNFLGSHPEDFEGTLEIEQGNGIAVTGLIQQRQTGALLAVPTGSYGYGTQSCPAPVSTSPTAVFPQFADGLALGKANRTRLIVRNNSNVTDTGEAVLRDSAGNAATLMINGQPLSRVPYNLPNWGVTTIQTDGSGDLQTGSVEIRSFRGPDSRLQSAEVFEVLGHFVSVLSCPVRKTHQIYVSRTQEENTGVAIYNVGPFGGTLNLFLLNESGIEVASRQIWLGRNSQIAVLIDEPQLFASFFRDDSATPFRGTLNIQCPDGYVSVVGLIQRRSSGALVAVAAGADAFQR